jgi:hypothetical protein
MDTVKMDITSFICDLEDAIKKGIPRSRYSVKLVFSVIPPIEDEKDSKRQDFVPAAIVDDDSDDSISEEEEEKDKSEHHHLKISLGVKTAIRTPPLPGKPKQVPSRLPIEEVTTPKFIPLKVVATETAAAAAAVPKVGAKRNQRSSAADDTTSRVAAKRRRPNQTQTTIQTTSRVPPPSLPFAPEEGLPVNVNGMPILPQPETPRIAPSGIDCFVNPNPLLLKKIDGTDSLFYVTPSDATADTFALLVKVGTDKQPYIVGKYDDEKSLLMTSVDDLILNSKSLCSDFTESALDTAIDAIGINLYRFHDDDKVAAFKFT